MINWYISLYLGIILLLYLFPYIGSFPSIREYSQSQMRYGGLGSGTNLLLSRLVSGELLVFAMISVISFGILGGIAFALMVVTSLLIYILTIHKLKKNKEEHGILELLRKQTDKFGYKYHIIVLVGVNFGNMILQLASLKFLLGYYFLQSSFLIVFFVSIFAFAYAGLGGFEALNKSAKPQVFIVFFSTAVITISVFLENGLAVTYQDMINIPFNSLSIQNAVILFTTGLIILTSQYLMDYSLWHTVYQLRPQRQNPILLLTMFCLMAIPLGYSALAIYGLSQGMPLDGNLILVLEENHSLFLINLYIITVFIAVISSFANQLFSTVILYLNSREQEQMAQNEQIKHGYLFSAMIVIFVSITFFVLQNLSLIKILITLGIIYTSMVIPFIHTLFRSSPGARWTDYIGLLSLMIGIVLWLFKGFYYIPFICLALGMLIQMGVLFFNKIHQEITKRE